MCGLTGFWQPTTFSADASQAIAEKMADRIAHRGPDDTGVWVDEVAGIALIHRRLSILDLSPAGHQPMVSPSGRFVIAFNGEIYNHLEMRRELEKTARPPLTLALSPEGQGCDVEGEGVGPLWRGHSDTETLLAGFEAWGIEATLKKTVGMFAIALWDREERLLTLSRDRIGEKPLYYGFQNDTFVFGSELKALKAHPDFLGEIDRDVICLYLRHCYIPAPYSIYKGIKKLLPGTYLQLPFGRDVDALRAASPKVYWSLAEVAAQGVAVPFAGSDADAICGPGWPIKTVHRFADDGGCAAWGVFVGRGGFFYCGCLDAGAVCSSGQDVFDRV
jgi:asparagine synthase (glutamine-hydrolysing)